MNRYAVLATIVSVVALVALLVVVRRGWRAGQWLTKPVASAGFVALAVANGAWASGYGRAVLAALAFSMLGDLLLIPASRAWFRLGLFAFLVGHIGFAVAFVLRGVAWPWSGAAAVLVATLAVVIGRWLLAHVERKMRPPVLAYIVVISAMVALAVGTTHATGDARIAAAAITFYASDLCVAREAFVNRSYLNRLIGLPLYYGAQLLFAWTV